MSSGSGLELPRLIQSAICTSVVAPPSRRSRAAMSRLPPIRTVARPDGPDSPRRRQDGYGKQSPLPGGLVGSLSGQLIRCRRKLAPSESPSGASRSDRNKQFLPSLRERLCLGSSSPPPRAAPEGAVIGGRS